MSRFRSGLGVIPVAEDKFEAVDPFALVSKENSFVLFEDVIELIPHETDGIAEASPGDDRLDERVARDAGRALER